MPPKQAQASKPPPKSSSAKKGASPAAKGTPAPTRTSATVKHVSEGTRVPAAKEKPPEQPSVTVVTAKKWTKQDEAARKIQKYVRRFLAKRQLARKKKERADYEEMMERLEREAYAKIVKMNQEEMEKQRKKDEEERKKLREMIRQQKRMLEAAFDGDNDEILAILKEVKELDDKNGVKDDVVGRIVRAKNQRAMVECSDANNNTPLSEASNGGHAKTIKLLIERGADPNSRGQFQRTPLYRAAFAGHLEAVQMLLQYGADPRLYAEDGLTPAEQSSFDHIRNMLNSWDMAVTDRLLQKLQADREKQRDEDRQMVEVETQRVETQLQDAEKEYATAEKQLMKSTCEMNKRVCEHDKAVVSGFARTDITVQMIHDSEADVEIKRLKLEQAREKVAKLRLALREKRGKENEEEMFASVKVLVRELDDVLLRDVGDRVKNSGRWPLIIDTSGQAATFLRYRDTNYINALSPRDVEPERIRMSVLGALRFGKPLVLDMMEVDMLEACERRFDEVQKGLLMSVFNKSILTRDVFTKLIRQTDGEQYHKNQFNELFLSNFKFFVITKNPFPPTRLVEMTYPVTVVVANTSLL